MLPLLGWAALGAGSLWVWNQFTGQRQAVGAPRRYDYSAAVMDPSLGLRVARHELRDSIHHALSNVVASPVMAGNGQQVPYWFAISPKTDARQTSVYQAIGAAIKQGKWVALRLDSIQQPEGGLLVSGPRAVVEDLCKGESPFCLIAKPRPPASTVTPPPGTKGGPSQEAIAKMFAEYIANMTPEQRKAFGAQLIEGAEPQEERIPLDPKDYARHSPNGVTHVEPQPGDISVESKTL
jgi:hypothetical protein